MHRRSFFRTPFGSQRVNGFQTLRNSARQHFYPTFSSFCQTQRETPSPLVRCEIVGLIVNPLTADVKHSRHNTRNLVQPCQMHFLKNKTLAIHSLLYLKNLHESLNIFKKNSASQLQYFRNYLLRKTGLIKCIAGPVSEHPSAVNVFTGPKH